MVKQDEVLGVDTMGISLQVFLYPFAYCIPGLASIINLHLRGMAICLKDAIQRQSPCVVSQRKSQGHREGWLMALPWADLRDRSVILSTFWRGYNKLMSLWRALVYSCLKEFIFSGGGYVLDLCLSCSWILSHVHRTLHQQIL